MDAPKSYVIILDAQSYKSLNGKNISFVLRATCFYTKNTVTTTSSILLELIWYEGQDQKVFYLF